MSEPDPVTSFYQRHPYPPPVTDLAHILREPARELRRRVEHHRRWPTVPFRDDHTILVAGCGTSQAARHALRNPAAQVIGIDVSSAAVEHTRALATRHGLDNLEVREGAIEEVGSLGRSFDHIVCTGVLHHLAHPGPGLRALRDVLEPRGAIDLMVYATFGRTGVSMLQDYCRRLDIDTSAEEIADLKASLQQLPLEHPLSHLLRDTPDFGDDDALADALLNPRDRDYTVPQLFELLGAAGLEFGRWLHQAPYLATCGAVAHIPHGPRLAALDPPDQFAAVELYRGTITRHSLIAVRDDGPGTPQPVRFDDDQWPAYVPLRPSSVLTVDDRLPPGVAAAVLNRAHQHTDLVTFLDEDERARFDAIDGRRTLADLGDDPSRFERWWQHDLVVIDASSARR